MMLADRMKSVVVYAAVAVGMVLWLAVVTFGIVTLVKIVRLVWQ